MGPDSRDFPPFWNSGVPADCYPFLPKSAGNPVRARGSPKKSSMAFFAGSRFRKHDDVLTSIILYSMVRAEESLEKHPTGAGIIRDMQDRVCHAMLPAIRSSIDIAREIAVLKTPRRPDTCREIFHIRKPEGRHVLFWITCGSGG